MCKRVKLGQPSSGYPDLFPEMPIQIFLSYFLAFYLEYG